MLLSILVDSRMAAKNESITEMTEECDQCGRATRHQVTVQLLTESHRRENAEFSREPYRVTECQVCGTTTALRMNNV